MPTAMDPQILAFTLAAAALTIAPGADTALVIRNVLRGGQRDGVITTLGICSGLFIHASLSALGVSFLLMQSMAVFNALKLIGAGYLIWLGVQSLLRAIRQMPVDSAQSFGLAPEQVIAGSQCFREGLLSNVLNPKTAAFYLAFLPQFILPTDSAFAKSILLAGIHYVEGIIWLGLLSVLLHHIRQYLLRPSVKRVMDGLCGAVLLGFGFRLALTRA